MKEEALKTISITLDPEVIKKLDEGNYNRSKLIDSLLVEYFKKNEKSNKSKK